MTAATKDAARRCLGAAPCSAVTVSVGGRVASGSRDDERCDRIGCARLDDATSTPVGAPIATGAQPKGVAVEKRAVWVANAGDCTIGRTAP